MMLDEKEIKDVIEIMNEAENVDDLRISFINYEKHSQVGISVKEIIAILNYQQAEIERLSKKNEELAEILSDTIRIRYAECKAEAIKEFAERLKEDFKKSTLWGLISFDRIDNIVKEMVGDDK